MTFRGISQISDTTTTKQMKISDNVVSTSNWSNFGMLSHRAGFSATAGLSGFYYLGRTKTRILL